MPASSQERILYVATAADIAIAGCKYLAAAITGSSAMLAEALHSSADTGNELLLLLGKKRSQRPPDALHPFGHGKALYFYSLLVSIYIFAVGGGLAVYEGISRLHHPETSSHTIWSYGVLGVAAAFEFYSWRMSRGALLSRKDSKESVWNEIIRSKDPTIFTVFLVDSAGLVGAFLAFLGIFLGHVLQNPYLDPIASILIGLLLAAVAILLGRESGELLVGERTNQRRVERLRKIIQADPSVEDVGDLLTMQLGPSEVLLAVDIKFRRELNVQQLEAAIDRLEFHIRQEEPMVQRIFIEADSLKRTEAFPPQAA